MFRLRVRPVLDGAHVGDQRGKRRVAAGLEVFDEARSAALSDIEDVIEDQNLSVDMRAGTDADDGHLERLGDHLPHLVGDALEQHDIGTGVLQATRRLAHLAGLVRLPALYLEATDLVHRLRLQAEMRAHRYVVTSEVRDDLHLVVTTLELDHHGPALLHQAHRVLERLRRIAVAHERHIRDKEGPPQSPVHVATVIDHVFDRDRNRRVVSLDDHSQRVTDQHQVGSRRVNEQRETGIVGGQAGDRLAFVLHASQGGDIDRRLCHAALFKLRIHVKLPVRQVRPLPG